MTSALKRLRELGQSVWLDDLRRNYLEDGSLAALIDNDGVSGVTTNPAIFERAVKNTGFYDAIITVCARFGEDAEHIYERLVIEDVQAAADALAPTYARTACLDGYVSLEVSPHLAHDTDATIAAATRLWSTVARPNLMIKVPGTGAGIAAVPSLIAEGINVNVTLLFSPERYIEVVDAYCCGLEGRLAAGNTLGSIRSVASFFVSRIDTAVDHALDAQSTNWDHSLRGSAAVATAATTYRAYCAALRSERWRSLVAQGAHAQRLLWASTGTKDPSYSDIKYVESLIAADTVTTLPMDTLRAYREHGDPNVRLPDAVDAALSIEASLKRLGIDLRAVSDALEQDGIQQFVDAYDRLIERIDTRRRQLRTTRDVGT